MRKKMLLILVFLFVFTMSSCQNEDTDPTVIPEGRLVGESIDNDFRITLYSDKDVYSENEEVIIWGTVEYIGSKNSIDIHSGEPYAGYNVESDGIVYISFMRLTLLKTTTLKKGEIYRFPLVKMGGFSEDAEDADFWRDFYSEEKMLFPKGEYQLTFSTDFYTDDSNFDLIVEYQFDVE